MVILFVHNYYQQPGGEDAGVRQERDLLAAAGHRIVEYARSSDEIVLDGLSSRVRLGTQAIWSQRTRKDLDALLQKEKPDVAHFHNIVPLISPSAYYACAEAGVPVVQTLHNYRLLCPAGTLLRQGHICEECIEHTLFRSVRYRCYHESASQTGTVALMLAGHRALGTWTRKVDCYIARTGFARRKFIEGGLPPERIVVKPCFVQPDPCLRAGQGDSVVFVGRLSPEKGPGILLSAWQLLDGRVPLRIVGDGPLRRELEAEARQRGIAGVTFLGQLEGPGVVAEMKRARFLVFPSEWYEGLPLVIAEAFACGVPVVASRLGSMVEIVEDGRTGLHFEPSDPEDLAAKIDWAWTHPKKMGGMGRNARTEYETKYTAERNYQLLMQISETAVQERRHRPVSQSGPS
jgi:glycosyltransferase involved in cell wall biosynthesis